MPTVYMQKANIAMPKQIIMYIASTAQASVFKNRCIELANEVEIATLKDFGEEPANDSFLKMNKLMLNGTINWTIFDWETVSKLVGGNVFVQELKELIRTGAIRRSKTYIVDRNDALGNKDIFANFGIGIVEDETLIGEPFNKMLSLEQMEIKKVENENELFGGMSAPSYANDSNRLPGMQDTTPSQVSKCQPDPFEEMAATAHPASPEEDPFTVYEPAPVPAPAPSPAAVPSPAPQSEPVAPADPFAAFTVGGAMSAAQSAPIPAEDDIFAELDGDLGGSVEDDLGNISGDDLYNDNLFDMLEEQADATIAAAETDDPFAAFSYMDDNTVLGGESAFDAGDPFADMEASMAQGLNPNGTVAVDDVIGGIGGVMSGSSVAEDVVGNASAPASATSGADDPFAAFDVPEQEPLSSAENVQQASDDDISAIFGDMEANNNDDASFDPFAEMDRGNNIAPTSSRLPAADNVFEDEPDEDNEFDDPFGEMSKEDLAMAQAVARGEMPIDEPPAHTPSPASNGQKFSSVEELLEMYGDGLGDNDFNKMMSMIEPMWDYSLEEADGVGGGGGLFKKGGTKGVGSQSEENELADSLYIDEMERINGYYSPPDDAKIITVNSQKGGTGKTSISVGIATQLNWYFNPKLMQRMTTNYNSRVLIFSTNEFDDIPVHGIGYEEAISEENDTDGKNVAELLRRIEDTNGQPMWDDIMHCFVSTEQNRVFYLPSLTQREILEDNINITAEDYKRVVECCSRFFQFIIIDTPDIFYQEKNDLMNFVYNVADIICMIIEPDLRSTANLYHFFDGLKTDTGKVPLNPDKCLLVVNKYVASGNPYMPVAPIGQIPYESICKNMSSYFARFCCLPFTRPRGYGNIIYGTDPKIKLAFGELVDIILEMIDYNDAQAAKKKLGKK